uniref:Uncharacterized protein n=1 Tax=Tanacetum cinerariifolium TaxID=118510 RepID=A0A699TWM8_TANCI|nr:hypothetical protein [Tanacetum cinerariifolium]
MSLLIRPCNTPSLSSRKKGVVDDSPTSWTLAGTVSSSCSIVFSTLVTFSGFDSEAGGEGLRGSTSS